MATTSFKHALALAGGVAVSLLAAGNAAALQVGPAQSTFYFTGNCSDCALDSPPNVGMLVLEGYTPGSAITESNFVAFAYNGSDLMYAYSVTRANVNPFLNVGDQYLYFLGGGNSVSGAMPAGTGPAAFRIVFEDGIGFESTATGDWFACGPGPKGYSSGSCDKFNHNDFGTGNWSTTAAVPEPASYALMGLGVLGLAVWRRRSAAR